MLFCCISDTHSDHHRLKNLPKSADVILHAGDCTHDGKIHEYTDFLDWYGALPYPHKILVPGNHDFFCEENPSLAKQMANEKGIHFLLDDMVEINNKVIYGSPWTPYCGNWAFSPKDYRELEDHFAKIPKETNILVTHGPPHGCLDGHAYGSIALFKNVKRCTNIQLHVFGHIHESYGIKKIPFSGPGPCRGITHHPLFVNAAMAGCRQHAYRNCASNHKPIIMEIP